MKTTDLKIEIQRTFTAPACVAETKPNLVRFFVIARTAKCKHFCSDLFVIADYTEREADRLIKYGEAEVAWVVRVELPPFE